MDTTLHDPLIGHVLDGRYRVDERIAVGGMATVYRALDTRLDRVLALKVMHPSLVGDAAFTERFIREAKAAARLAHPNIVGVLDQGRDGGHVYLAMEYVAGCTLRDLLRGRGALQPRAVLDIMEPMLAGLAAAHRAGLVHRDIKPENVLIGDDGRVKVADFGLVRGVDSQTSATTGSVLGTVSYLAPEQIEGGAVDTRSDVYACGLLLYEMLTGAKAHQGDSPARVLYARVHEDVPAPSAAVRGLAPELDGLVAAAAARVPGDRPADAAAMLGLVRAARAAMTDQQLDAQPPASALAGAVGSEDLTRKVPRVPVGVGARGDGPHVTSRIELPDGASLPPAAPPGRRVRAGVRGWLPRRRALPLIALVLLLVAGGVGVWYINSGQFMRTPGVYDLTVDEATAELRDAGLKVRIEEGFSETVEPGHVIATDPERGERIRRNATVTLTVSLGPEIAEVPNVRGMPLDEAEAELRGAGLTPGEEEWVFSDEVPRGSVLETDPAPGEERRPDSAVRLVVSKGPEIDVPDVTGMSESVASARLESAGFEVDVEPRRVYSDEEAGTVAAQSPGGDETAAEGDTVHLTLSRGPEMIEVPDVGGMSAGEARDTLEDAGFEVNLNRIFLLGNVFNQSPEPGDRAPRGSTVTIWVN
ncbi:Stk1 family PASTA domain-containing Ser/Thr kinase [Streptomyces radicis]|uniref:non-specific serine/threonine protein kinase n=1 Tax=Streptomyces radicis TaxID=1750517 RepID=A0A3A9W062_9ACTN|nr:Stk1 family PASTA domain-containing Ser/Thr kinase [Streptomyces radicis]RKN06132.1 Stk1 family PASTA domain-containing Ser/Thr kinase [Streptomyces radicis]RKN18502.1 Stk1 family PASTA domain-containing Ser/Thr kinase [Streptomyces radicis]